MTINPNSLKNLKSAKKGEVRNPLGAGAISPEMRALKRLTNAEFADIGSLIVKGNLEGLKKIAADKKASVLQVWIASISIKAINRGDVGALDHILNRIVGKVPDEIHMNSQNLNANFNTEVDADKVKRVLDKLREEV